MKTETEIKPAIATAVLSGAAEIPMHPYRAALAITERAARHIAVESSPWLARSAQRAFASRVSKIAAALIRRGVSVRLRFTDASPECAALGLVGTWHAYREMAVAINGVIVHHVAGGWVRAAVAAGGSVKIVDGGRTAGRIARLIAGRAE